MPEPQQTVLVVDDESAIRRIAVRVLQRAGYTCFEAADGQEGFKLWQDHRDEIALVITDVMMPRQNGWDLVLGVRATGSKTPFVVTSGFDASEVIPPGTEEGVIVVSKPWETTTLVAAVKKLLG